MPAQLSHLTATQRIRGQRAVLGPTDAQGGCFEIDGCVAGRFLPEAVREFLGDR
jgi:hypothetical protein